MKLCVWSHFQSPPLDFDLTDAEPLPENLSLTQRMYERRERLRQRERERERLPRPHLPSALLPRPDLPVKVFLRLETQTGAGWAADTVPRFGCPRLNVLLWRPWKTTPSLQVLNYQNSPLATVSRGKRIGICSLDIITAFLFPFRK